MATSRTNPAIAKAGNGIGPRTRIRQPRKIQHDTMHRS
jgi:hypothetical protein